LSSALDKFNEATEQIRQLENQNKALKSEIDDKIVEIRELEKKKQQRGVVKSFTTEGKSTDRVLAAQLQHSQNQVRLLKSTMEQFLKMGVFNDDLNSSNSSCTSPTT
jgi:septal ring factor EnvC (AmiA/AmiB activator)